MTRKTLGRTLVGAALTVVLSTLTLGPASAAPVIAWDGITPDGSYAYGAVPTPTCSASDDVDATIALTCVVTGAEANPAVGSHTLTATVSDINGSVVTSETISYTVTSWLHRQGLLLAGEDDQGEHAQGRIHRPAQVQGLQGRRQGDLEHRRRQHHGPAVRLRRRRDDPDRRPDLCDHRKEGLHPEVPLRRIPPELEDAQAAQAAKVKGKKVVATACYLVTATMDDTSTLSAQFLLK